MPFWPRKRSVRHREGKVTTRKVRYAVKVPRGVTQDRTALANEIEAEMSRNRAAIEEIARRHGGTVELLDED
jgi:uncharacterized protein YecE (DUF72 family)